MDGRLAGGGQFPLDLDIFVDVRVDCGVSGVGYIFCFGLQVPVVVFR